jgi:hypothetical protein
MIRTSPTDCLMRSRRVVRQMMRTLEVSRDPLGVRLWELLLNANSWLDEHLRDGGSCECQSELEESGECRETLAYLSARVEALMGACSLWLHENEREV